MDSHINTADPWAATTEPPEPEVQEVHEPEPGADDDIVDAESPPAEDGSKGGLFGRRKIRERSSSEGEKGFDLIAPAHTSWVKTFTLKCSNQASSLRFQNSASETRWAPQRKSPSSRRYQW